MKEILGLDNQCAAAMGVHVVWGLIPCPDGISGCCVAHYGYYSAGGGSIRKYSSRLDDARLLEDEIERRGLTKRYVETLAEQLGVTAEMMSTQGAAAFWMALRATPEQRAQAFLAVVEAANAQLVTE